MDEFEAGKIAEKFFKKYSGHLIHRNYIHQQTSAAHIGGKDFSGLSFGELKDSKPVIGGLPYEQKPHKIAVDLGEADAEVKGILGKTLLKRDNNDNEPSGTIEFEMWSNAWKKVKGSKKRVLTPRSVWTHGWLHGYLHPVEHNKELRERGITDITYTTPEMLIYVYYADWNAEEPFVVIAFEDFGKLVERLKTISPWKLDPWEVDFVSEERFNTITTPSRSYLLDNMWHVPLEAVADLATVTMINDDPHTSGGIDKTRLEYLKKLAEGRHLDTVQEDKNLQRVEEAIERDRKARKNSTG